MLQAATSVLCLCISSAAQFETRTSLFVITTTASHPFVATGDFNGDGKLDLAMPDPSNAQVAVLLGKGDGTFRSPVKYAVGENPLGVVVGDFNHDGHLDLAVTYGVSGGSGSSGGVNILLGNGDGTFQPAKSFSLFEAPVSVVAGDLKGDGQVDLVALEQYGFGSCPCVGVLLGNGDGTFQPSMDEPIPFGIDSAIAVGDFNADGKSDVAVSGWNEVGILLSNGDGTFREGASYSTGFSPDGVAAADLNGDGKLDLVTANSAGISASVLLGNGDGTFQPAVNYPVPGYPVFVAVADLNGDNKPDLVIANFDSQGDATLKGAASILFGNGDGTFQPVSNYTVGKGSISAAVGDFNSDKKADVVVADPFSGDVTIVLNTGLASFSPTSPVSFPAQLVGTTSTPQTVTLTNNGPGALLISSITVQGSQFRLSSGKTTCAGSVPPAGNCVIAATFQPQSKGGKSGTVTIVDSASSKPQVVELSGTGTVVQIFPKKLSFPNTKVGTKSAPLPVTIMNTGSTVLNFTQILLSNGNDFSQTNTCGTQIAAGATCKISVTFTPFRTGLRTGMMSISDDGGGSPQSVSMSGTGT